VERHGRLKMQEAANGNTPERRQQLQQRIFTDHELPQFDRQSEGISCEHGCTIYFADDTCLTIPVAAPVPMIRVFSEAETAEAAQELSRTVAAHYRLGA